MVHAIDGSVFSIQPDAVAIFSAIVIRRVSVIFVRRQGDIIFKTVAIERRRVAVYSPSPDRAAGGPPIGIESQLGAEKWRAQEQAGTKNGNDAMVKAETTTDDLDRMRNTQHANG